MTMKANEKSLEFTRKMTQRLAELKNDYLIHFALEIAKKVIFSKI